MAMKNQKYHLRISLWTLSLMVSFLSAYSFPGKITGPKGTSITNITICNNQLPYQWNSITCLTAGTYSVSLTGSNGTDSTAILNLSVLNVGTSITNAIVCDDDLPYQWNGNSYSSNGTFSVTLTSSSGCDSVPILSLTVNHVVTSTTNRTICSNQLPFNWNGNNYVAAGIYSVALTSAANCDSIATLNLSVNAVSSSATAVTICNSQLPYSWNGNPYPAAGSYSLTFLNSSGCDSVATLNLSTNPAVTSNTFITICNNQLPYNWNNNNFAGAGNYNVTLTGSSGCDSIATLHLSVLPPSTSATFVVICNAQLPYSWNGNSYPATGNYSVTLTSTAGCDSIAILHLVSVPFLTSQQTHYVCNNELPYLWNGISYFVSGDYTASFVNSAGCDSIATLHLFIISPLVNTDSVSICEADLPYNWYGNIISAGGTYVFSPPVVMDACHLLDSLVLSVQVVTPSTTTVAVCTNNLPFVWNGNNYSATGIYGVVLPSSSGCDSLANLDLTVAALSTSTTDISICSNQVPYNWNGNNFTGTGVYPVTLTGSNGCDSIATLNLVVNQVTSSSTDINVCNTQLPYSWNGNSYSTNGTYSVTLMSSSGCDSVATLHFVILPFLSSTANISICSNQLPYTWSGNSYSSAGVYTINFTSSAGCDSVATLNLVINDVITSTTNVSTCINQLPFNWNGIAYNASGIYTATLITAGGCDSVATLNLVVNPTVGSNTDMIICNNQLPYSWNGNSYPGAGIYQVTLVSSAGCDSIATLNLQVTDILTSTTNVNICPALLPYSWNGNSYATGGTYSVTLSNPAGCDSVPILSLTIVPYVTSFTNITICNNELPYTWNGNTFSGPGTYPVLMTGSSVCDSLATLNLTALPAITSTTAVTICDNELPYSWNGNNYPASGNYSITFTSSGGCDSTATLILTVNSTTSSNTELSICDTQLPFIWNGNSYPVAGIYSVTLTGSTGCDSLATLTLTANPVITSNTDITICTSQLPYSWNGNTYPTAGTYIVNLTSNAGCDSIATLQLFVNPILTSGTIVNTCVNQVPYSWNGQDYSNTGIYSITLTASSGCDSVATLDLTVNPVVASNSNFTICNNLLPYSWNGQLYSTAGMHTVTLTSSVGCDSVATLNLMINPVSYSNTIASTCENQLPFSWNGQNYLTSGNYIASLINSTGCDSIATLELTVNPVATSNTTAATCSGELPYSWNGQNYTSAGPHLVTLVSASGCDSIATLNLIIQPTPVAPTVISPISYCQQETTSALIATSTTAGAQLLWYTTPSGGNGSPNAPVPSSENAGIINYYVSQVDGACEGPRALITVTVNSKPALGPDKPIKICFGQSANISTLYNTIGLAASWNIDQQPVPDSSGVAVAGIYQLIVQNNFGCSDTALVNVGINPPVIANAGNDGDAEYNIPYQLTGSGGGNYQWTPSGVLNNPFIGNPLAVLTQSTTFVLLVKDDIGCFDLDTVMIRVLKGPTFYVPSAFTPNGDGLNDVFKPTPIGIASLEFFRVYNRYGELVYETHDIGKGWDGTYRGVRQNMGNYVWSLKGTDRLGDAKVMRGNVVLIRQ
ncbi:MAG: T9SS type B sorting domain-containing protein [Ferruginibacter sp.]